MNITETANLNEKNIRDIMRLINVCTQEYDLKISFPFADPEAFFFLGYEKDELNAVMVLCQIDDYTFEALAWTLPEYRNRGCFNSLWNKAGEFLTSLRYTEENLLCTTGSCKNPHPFFIHFIWDHCCPASEAVIKKLGAIHLADEYLMYTDLTPYKTSSCQRDIVFTRTEKKADGIICFRTDSIDSIMISPYDRPDVADKNNSYPAGFNILPEKNGKGCFLSDFFIRSDLRGRGLGLKVFTAAVIFLSELGYKKLSLQVNAANTAAVKIYRNSGLSVGVELTYYELIL